MRDQWIRNITATIIQAYDRLQVTHSDRDRTEIANSWLDIADHLGAMSRPEIPAMLRQIAEQVEESCDL